VVSREGLVAIETNRYSVPAHLMGRALTARIHAERVELFADQERVATHVSFPGQHTRIIDPTHFEAAFPSKPRGRVMVYRETLFITALQIPPLPTHSVLRGLQFVLFSHHARTARPRSQHRAGAS